MNYILALIYLAAFIAGLLDIFVLRPVM